MVHKILIGFITLLISTNSVADLYFELGIEGGGDRLISDSTGTDINAGGGVKFAIGVQEALGEDADRGFSLALGYLWDEIDAVDGNAEFETLTFDAIYQLASENHLFGIGFAYHIGPEFSLRLDGLGSASVEFDDALGTLFQYTYASSSNFGFGLRYTVMEYEIDNASIDADSVGLFISTVF